MAPNEQILVVERTVVERVRMFHGLQFDVEPYLAAIFAAGTPRFMVRSKAETDPSFKQIIPYVLISHGGKFLSYVRGKRAGETRLVGNRSIGIGGHINPVDELPLFGDLREAYRTAVEREVAEEISVEAGHTDRVVALLNDDSNDVGKVHLGIVHHWNLDAPNVTRREQMITQTGFMTPAELLTVADTLETWSRLCLESLNELARQNKD